MALNERLMEDMKAAMKAGPAGKVRLEAIRILKAEIKNVEIEKKRPLTDDEILEVITKQVKKLKDSIADFEKGGRSDMAAKVEADVAVLVEYLPQAMSEAEIRELAQQVIAEVGAQGPKDLGKVMGPILSRTKGRADGKLVNQIVKELLG
jgi:uncharacterized protein YqeY